MTHSRTAGIGPANNAVPTRRAARDQTVDALRGLAVSLMVAGHTTDFLRIERLGWLVVRDLANALCYSIFLFTFGLSAYLSVLNRPRTPATIRGALRRTSHMYAAYVIMAGWSIWLESGMRAPTRYLSMLVFVDVPGNVEFMIAFFLLMLGIVGVRARMASPERSPWLQRFPVIMGVGAAAFALGALLFAVAQRTSAPDPLAAYIGIVAGYPGLLRFPLLQFMPTLLLGIWVGARMVALRDPGALTRLIRTLAVALTLAYGVLEVLYTQEQRWPPSLHYVVRGLSFTCLTFWLIRRLPSGVLLRVLAIIGQQALVILVFHTVCLNYAAYLKIEVGQNLALAIGWWLAMLLGGAGLKWVWQRLRGWRRA